MSTSTSSFTFSDEKAAMSGDGFYVRLPAGIQDKAGLLSAFYEAARFPAYFGNNWDALNDCLRDFSWVEQQRVTIIHDDIPMSGHADDLLTYLEILDAGVKFWRQNEHHNLTIIFPKWARATIARSLKDSKS
jgi:RNAse (barnase) inhibitor barstar